MRVVKWKDEGLILEGDLALGIEEAFNERRYVEAFALLHGWLNWLMHFIFENYEVSKGGKGGADLRSLIDENPSWKTALDRLSKNRIISEKECQRLIAFNGLRNSVIHRLIVRSYQPSRPEKLAQAEVEEGFNEGKALVKLLKEKTGSVFLSKHERGEK